MTEIKSDKDMSLIALGLWRFNDKIIHSTTTKFTGNCLSSHDDNCMNEILVYFGYRPKQDSVFEIVDSMYKMTIGKTVCINIFSEDKNQWKPIANNNEKLYLKILNNSQIHLSFSSIAMQNVLSFDRRILFCSGIIQERSDFSKGCKKTILRKLFKMRKK